MPKRRISIEAARELLHGSREHAGMFEQVVGFGAGTAALKAVHVMNDLAQTVLGGCPKDGGDLLCRVIREGIGDDEDNGEATLRRDVRFGADFSRAFPIALGSAQVRRLRLGARALLNVDGGMYLPSTQMASSVATNKALLGAEGFRRFRMGRYLAAVLDETARARLVDLYSSDRDPVSKALRPLFQAGEGVGDRNALSSRELSGFDRELGRGLGQILRQPLSKPAILRNLALASSLGLALRVFGAGFTEGRPVMLALNTGQRVTPSLREKAVLCLRRCTAEFDRELARSVAASSAARDLWRDAKAGDGSVEVTDGAPEAMAQELIEKLRRARQANGDDGDSKRIYWPQDGMVAFGRRGGFILPKDNRAGWGVYLCLTPEAVEVLALMLLPWGERVSWTEFWAEVRRRYGVVVGANQHEDAEFLSSAGVSNASLEDLSRNAMALLEQSVERGVARLLPDSGAEVGGFEQ